MDETTDRERRHEAMMADLSGGMAAGDPAVEVGAGSILLGGGGPILVGAGFPLPSFVELPKPWWCYPKASE